jgi:hypothetical protein
MSELIGIKNNKTNLDTSELIPESISQKAIEAIDKIKLELDIINPVELEEDFKIEIAEYVNLLQQIQEYKIPNVIESVELGIYFLLKEKNIIASKKLRENLQQQVKKYRFWYRVVIRSWSAPSKVIAGLLFALYVPYLPLLFGLMALVKTVLGIDTYLLTIAGLGGGLGSIASILLRIRDFKECPQEDKLIPLFIGFFKPAIVTILGIFIFCLLASGIIPIKIPDKQEQKQEYFIFTYAFIAGFSERFARDIMQKIEKSTSNQ